MKVERQISLLAEMAGFAFDSRVSELQVAS